MAIHIEATPAGVVVTRFGPCGPEEFELHGNEIWRGPRGQHQIVVVPAEGYKFVQKKGTPVFEAVKDKR